MAGEAAIIYFGMINVNFFPIGIIMAICAEVCCFRVVYVLALRHVAIVTTGAGCGYAFENTTFMAFFTGDPAMHTLKRKFRSGMVKVLINLDPRRLGLRIDWRSHKPKARDKNHDDLQQHFEPANFQIIHSSKVICWPFNDV
jgi:hypothetical protein